MRVSDEVDRIAAHPLAAATPFKVLGAPNVMLETVKRGEDDSWTGEGEKTIILRLYEHFGGHAKATLNMCVTQPSRACARLMIAPDLR